MSDALAQGVPAEWLRRGMVVTTPAWNGGRPVRIVRVVGPLGRAMRVRWAAVDDPRPEEEAASEDLWVPVRVPFVVAGGESRD